MASMQMFLKWYAYNRYMQLCDMQLSGVNCNMKTGYLTKVAPMSSIDAASSLLLSRKHV